MPRPTWQPVRRSRRFGFDGAGCIHPGQVKIVNEEYTPDAEEVAYARKVIALDHEAALVHHCDVEGRLRRARFGGAQQPAGACQRILDEALALDQPPAELLHRRDVLGLGAGAQRLGAARAALVSTVEPVYTIVAAGILFGEQLTPTQLAGGAAIFAAVLVAEWEAIRPAKN